MRRWVFSPEKTAGPLERGRHWAGGTHGPQAASSTRLPLGWSAPGLLFPSGKKSEGYFFFFGVMKTRERPERWVFLYVSHSHQSGSSDAGYGLGLRFWKPFLKVDLLALPYF